MILSSRPAQALFFLCACSGCWAFGFGLEFPLASRWLQEAGKSDSFIGFNTGSHFLGVLIAGIFTPRLMRRAGRGCVLVGLLFSGLGVAAFPWTSSTAGWFALRLMAGAGGALTMIALETLINLNAPPERRGRDFAFYAGAVGIGFALGSFSGLQLFAIDAKMSFLLGAVALVALPLVLMLPPFPELPPCAAERTPLRAPFLSLSSSWSQGFLEVGMLALLPLYLRAIGMGDADTGTLIGGVLIGVLICQVPIGWLADRLGRERILIACFLVVAVCLAVVPSVDPSFGLPLCLLAIGACAGAFYPLGLALLGERLPAAELPRANACFLSMNAFGSLVSPWLSGLFMQQFGPEAMFWVSETVIVSVLSLWLISRFMQQTSNLDT